MTTITESFRLTIETTWYGPTDHRGSRVKATAGKGRTVWVNCEYGRDEHHHDDHDRAMTELMLKMGWRWNTLKASRPDNCGYVYVSMLTEKGELS